MYGENKIIIEIFSMFEMNEFPILNRTVDYKLVLSQDKIIYMK